MEKNYRIISKLVQGTDKWLKARSGKISGTKLSSVMGGEQAQLTLIYELIAEQLSPLEEQFTTPAMERGNILEPMAAEEYEKKTGDKLHEVGIIIRDKRHILSPDRIIYKNKSKIINKAIEIKCLAAKKQVRYMTASNFIDVYKIDKTYFRQVVNYFLVINTLEELDFVLYNPDMYKQKHEMFVINVKREEILEYINKAEERLNSFIRNRQTIENKILKGRNKK